jgi:hypothetical protein
LSICIVHSSDARLASSDVNAHVLRTFPSGRTFEYPQPTSKEIDMKTLYALTLASLIGLATPIASADDAAAVKPRPAKAQAVATTPATESVKVSQQDKMRLCAKQATGKKGPERKTFMKTCLSKKA